VVEIVLDEVLEEELVVEIVLVEVLEEVDVLDVVVADGTKAAVSASGPPTIAVVAAEVWFERVVFPVLESHPEKRKPWLAMADIVTVEEALNQVEPEGVVVPAPWGDTARPTEYC